MKGLGKSCLRWLVYYAVLGAALSYLAYERVPNMRMVRQSMTHDAPYGVRQPQLPLLKAAAVPRMSRG